jgi:hypothetical protein
MLPGKIIGLILLPCGIILGAFAVSQVMTDFPLGVFVTGFVGVFSLAMLLVGARYLLGKPVDKAAISTRTDKEG